MNDSDGCKPNVPSSGNAPPSVPGFPIARSPLSAAYPGSPQAGTAANPSSAPRRITNTSRGFLPSAVPANVTRELSNAPPAANAPAARNSRLLIGVMSQHSPGYQRGAAREKAFSGGLWSQGWRNGASRDEASGREPARPDSRRPPENAFACTGPKLKASVTAA